MKITVKLLSDLCMYSGETYNSLVDTDVVHDENGIPYIPAKRLKGCIREAALELKEFDLISSEEYDELFGTEGNCSSAFTLSNAFVEGYEEMVKSLKACPWQELKTAENVLQQYSYVRKQTAVDLETGVAETNSLRSARVIRKGLTFTADCDWVRTVSRPEILKKAVSLVKHIGLSRTRGLGMVEMNLDDTENPEDRHVLIDRNQLKENNKIRYTVYLKSPLICKSPQGNQAVTEDYISGSRILGLIAGGMTGPEYRDLMSDGFKLTVSNAYIMNGEKRCLPGEISLQKEKDCSYDENGTVTVEDMLLTDLSEVKGRQMTPANISYVDEDGTVADIVSEISYHHQRPADKSIGRATGKDESSFYQLAALSPGQKFAGYIYAGKEQAEKVLDTLDSLKAVRMGYGKSSEFGAVDFSVDAVSEWKREGKKCKDAKVLLASDLLLYNENGMLTTDIAVLEQKLRTVTGVSDLVIRKPFLCFKTTGGYNVTWQCRKPVAVAFGKGSTFLLHSDSGFDTGLLDDVFIGERTAEGYGELSVKECPETGRVELHRKKEENLVPAENMANVAIIRQLLNSEFEHRMEENVREIAENNKGFCKSNKTVLNASVSKLRVIYKNERSYEGLKEQVEGIESEEKKKFCNRLVKSVKPDELKEKVVESIHADYDPGFETDWSEEKLFKFTYRVYLTELKHIVKMIQQGGEK